MVYFKKIKSFDSRPIPAIDLLHFWLFRKVKGYLKDGWARFTRSDCERNNIIKCRTAFEISPGCNNNFLGPEGIGPGIAHQCISSKFLREPTNEKVVRRLTALDFVFCRYDPSEPTEEHPWASSLRNRNQPVRGQPGPHGWPFNGFWLERSAQKV